MIICKAIGSQTEHSTALPLSRHSSRWNDASALASPLMSPRTAISSSSSIARDSGRNAASVLRPKASTRLAAAVSSATRTSPTSCSRSRVSGMSRMPR